MTYSPSKKVNLHERLAMLRRCLQPSMNVGLDQLCQIFDASVEDLRMFIKLNDVSLSDAFEDRVKKAEAGGDRRSYASEQQHRLHRHVGMNAIARRQASAAERPEPRTSPTVQKLIDILNGRSFDEERPFNLLPERLQEEIREQAILFVAWRDNPRRQNMGQPE